MRQTDKAQDSAVSISKFFGPISRIVCKASATGVRYKRSAICPGYMVAAALPVLVASGQQIDFRSFLPNGMLFPNSNGAFQTQSTSGGGIDQTGPFFQSMGTNGRSCATCHQPGVGMSVSATSVERRLVLNEGKDPIFRTVDSANCDHNIDVSTSAEEKLLTAFCAGAV